MKCRMLLAIAWTMVASASTTTLWGAEPTQPTAAENSAELKVGVSYDIIAEIVSETRDGRTQPVLRAGRFIIPADSSGVNLQYRFDDPGLDYTSTRLRKSNLYSVTEGRYLRELESEQIVALPPGEYRFEVGGSPGAAGDLTITVIPGAPGARPPVPPVSTGSTAPPTTKPSPPTPPNDDETQSVMKAVAGAWSGSYTVEKITGDVSGLGTVVGRRAIGFTIQPDEAGFNAEGVVWMPPGWFGQAGRGSLEGKSVWFYVTGKPTVRGILYIDFKGTVNDAANTMAGSLTGYMPKGESSEEVFRGSWEMKRK